MECALIHYKITMLKLRVSRGPPATADRASRRLLRRRNRNHLLQAIKRHLPAAARSGWLSRSGWTCSRSGWSLSRPLVDCNRPGPPPLWRQHPHRTLRCVARLQPVSRHRVDSLPHLQFEGVEGPLQNQIGPIIHRRQRRLHCVVAHQNEPGEQQLFR